MSDHSEVPKLQEEEASDWELVQEEGPEMDDILTPRSSTISPTSSTPSSSPNARKVKHADLFEIDNSQMGTPIPQMSNLTLQAEKSIPEKGPKTPDTEKNDDTTITEEIDKTIDITVKQNNNMMKYELKPIDKEKIEKGIKRIKNRLVQAENNDSGASNLECMEAESSTSLDENSEVWEPTPNGQEALEDTMDTTIEQGARSCVAQRTRSHTEVLREKMEENRSLNISRLKKLLKI